MPANDPWSVSRHWSRYFQPSSLTLWSHRLDRDTHLSEAIMLIQLHALRAKGCAVLCGRRLDGGEEGLRSSRACCWQTWDRGLTCAWDRQYGEKQPVYGGLAIASISSSHGVLLHWGRQLRFEVSYAQLPNLLPRQHGEDKTCCHQRLIRRCPPGPGTICRPL